MQRKKKSGHHTPSSSSSFSVCCFWICHECVYTSFGLLWSTIAITVVLFKASRWLVFHTCSNCLAVTVINSKGTHSFLLQISIGNPLHIRPEGYANELDAVLLLEFYNPAGKPSSKHIIAQELINYKWDICFQRETHYVLRVVSIQPGWAREGFINTVFKLRLWMENEWKFGKWAVEWEVKMFLAKNIQRPRGRKMLDIMGY